MDEALQRLLEVERRAEEIARQADAERERAVQAALEQARTEEQNFEARVPEIHKSFLDKSEQHAEQTIAELRRRHQEKHAELREQAEEREREAVEAAFQVLIDPAQ